MEREERAGAYLARHKTRTAQDCHNFHLSQQEKRDGFLKKTAIGLAAILATTVLATPFVKNKSHKEILPLPGPLRHEIQADQNYIQSDNSIPNWAYQEAKPIPRLSEGESRTIVKVAQRKNLDPLLLAAVRIHENGPLGREFGVLKTRAYIEDIGLTDSEGRLIRPYESDFEKETTWAANNLKRGAEGKYDPGKILELIPQLADNYCPKETDPTGNKNWRSGVPQIYSQLHSKFSK